MKDIFKDFGLKLGTSVMYLGFLIFIGVIIELLYVEFGLMMLIIPFAIAIMYLVVHKFHLY